MVNAAEIYQGLKYLTNKLKTINYVRNKSHQI